MAKVGQFLLARISVVVVRVCDERHDVDVSLLCGVGQTVEEGVVGLVVRPQKKLSLRASTSDQVRAPGNNLPWE
jgi:hypothetical protein